MTDRIFNNSTDNNNVMSNHRKGKFVDWRVVCTGLHKRTRALKCNVWTLRSKKVGWNRISILFMNLSI